ncbi:hypothetical protein ACFFQF_18800 [Haladaptatus pallidirubidus]|uniref:Uncharacterized protein n=1 Tax=Haladaptatus pallidirubidus TaxID=1008152 RepID=A0AAV3US30_9EURY|nr:hypothetical protein [Haladaptatus pallidirubidus]
MGDDVTRNHLLTGRRESAFIALLIGFITGCWIGYVLIYPISSLPLPRYTLVSVILLGAYIDYVTRSMLDRLLIVFAASLIAFVIGFVVYTFPALVGWYNTVLIQRSLYLSGLRKTFLFALLAMTLLLMGTLISYIIRNTYAEVTR